MGKGSQKGWEFLKEKIQKAQLQTVSVVERREWRRKEANVDD